MLVTGGQDGWDQRKEGTTLEDSMMEEHGALRPGQTYFEAGKASEGTD